MPTKKLLSRALVPLVLLVAAAGHAAPPRSPEWKNIQKLIADQKMEAASQLVAKVREHARAAGDESEWTEALIKEVQLRVSLGGFETAVRFLRDQPWPKGALHRTALDLFYAFTLTSYLDGYSWEIARREKVDSKGPIDLKKWTGEQIFAEAQRAYQEAWSRRAALGAEPVGALSGYLAPNNYPAEIRGTLRDSISYLSVELLANSARWRPEEGNELYKLDLAALIAGGDARRAAAVKVDDVALHPLQRIGAILDDLEAWHAGAGHKEAALEARLERARRLNAAFSDESSRAAIRADLVKRLPEWRKVAWWSEGETVVAELVAATGDLVQARQLALEAAAAYPQSIGGMRGLHVAKSIEAPDFQLSAMTSDGPGKRSIEVTHKNLGKLYFRAYAVDLIDRVQSAHDYNLLPAYNEFRAMVPGHPTVEWSADLPATPDYQSHRTFVTPPMRASGLYTVFVSARPDFREAQNRVLALNLIIGDLVLITRTDPQTGNIEATVISGESGRPVDEAEVLLYRYDWRSKHTQVDNRRTDARGAVTFQSTRARANNGSYFLVARKKGDVAIEGNYLNFYGRGTPGETAGSLVYTDRSIYRPLQKLFWKTVAYRGRGDQGSFHTVPNQKMLVALVDANNQEVERREVTTNDFGSAAGEFALPAGRLLGRWTVTCSYGPGTQQVRVEEYKRPTFEVSFKDPESALRLNQPARLVGEAKYYFGLPVTSGTVKWRVTREPVYPSWWWWYAPRGGAHGAQTVAVGASPLEPDGKFHIVFTPQADEKQSKTSAARQITYRYSVAADLTDEGGETRSASRGFRLGVVTVEAQLATESGFLRQGEPSELTMLRTDLDGAPRAGRAAWKLFSLTQPARTVTPAELPLAAAPDDHGFHTPGDRLRPRGGFDYSPAAELASWQDGAERLRGEVTHDKKGLFKLALPPLPPGAYRLRYETVDDFGAKFETFHDLVVAASPGTRTPLALPALFEAERGQLKVGGTARLLALSALPEQWIYLDKFSDGHLVERRHLGPSDPTVIEIPIGEGDRGGFTVTMWMVRDHQRVVLSQSLFVPWDSKELSVELSTFRDLIRPGGKETWRVSVKGAGAEAGAAELLAYMYDRSLDVFAPHTPPSPLALYPSHTGAGSSNFSLSWGSTQWVYSGNFYDLPAYPGLSGDALYFFDGYGLGGMGTRWYRRGEGNMPMGAAAAPMLRRALAKGEKGDMTGSTRSAVDEPESANGWEDEDGRPDQTVEKPKESAHHARERGGKEAGPQPTAVRANFAETAFWQPRLLTDGKGDATIEFTVPDSVTGWNVWVHALTRELHAGAVSRQTRTVKDLMVRPYLPRFFREGDRADLKIVVNNAGEETLSGTLDFDVIDPDTQKSVRDLFGVQTASLPFTVKAGAGANLSIPVIAPKKVGLFAVKVTAHSGNLADGELRPLPVLPGRMHLSQSRFVTLRDRDKRVMKFDDLARGGDPTMIQEQLVVTVDAQLFYTVLKALPYLINYPYECAEQTVNRFVSTGIVSAMFKQYPQVAKMAEGFAKRQTQLETFDSPDPNRKMTLEESPWLQESKGSDTNGVSVDLINVLDQRVARANRDSALVKLRKMQNANGSFPWFPGGPPSPYMTLYIMSSFAKAAEFGVDVPRDMIVRGWAYLAQHYRDHYIRLMRKNDADWEFLTFLNYTASSYPDASYTGGALTEPERKEILDYSYRHWKAHSPFLKGMLALTLKRMGRAPDGVKVFESVMDSAKTAKDQGTFWAQEDRSWLWYNDTIESHAFALRVLMELMPDHPKKDGLVLWLLLNKKMNQWKSTRATAEVIYSLIHYLQKEGALGIREDALVTVGPVSKSYTFEPDHYAGKQQLVLTGPQIDPQRSSTITVEKQSKGIVFASATWSFSTEKLPTEARGDFFEVHRAYFKRENKGQGFTLTPLAEGAAIAPGDQIEVQLSLRAKHQSEYVHLRDPRAAGLEPDLTVSQYKWDLGIGWYEETRDSGANFFFESLPAGEYTFKYRLRANIAGTFRVGPATVQSMYAPEFNAYSAGNMITVK